MILLALALYAWGLSLPTDHEINLSKNLTAPPGHVFATIANFVDHPKWRSGVTRVDYAIAARRVVKKTRWPSFPTEF